jgi:hypothetical protein
MQQGANLYNSGAGSQTMAGHLPRRCRDQTQRASIALSGAAQRAKRDGRPALQLRAGDDPEQRPDLRLQRAAWHVYGNIASGQNGITTGGAFGDIANSANSPTSSSQNLGGMASGADAGKNPYLMDMLAANDAQIANRVNSSSRRAWPLRLGRAWRRAGAHDQRDEPPGAVAGLRERPQPDAVGLGADRQFTTRAGGVTSGGNAGPDRRAGQNIGNQMQGAQGQTGILNFGQQNARTGPG